MENATTESQVNAAVGVKKVLSILHSSSTSTRSIVMQIINWKRRKCRRKEKMVRSDASVLRRCWSKKKIDSFKFKLKSHKNRVAGNLWSGKDFFVCLRCASLSTDSIESCDGKTLHQLVSLRDDNEWFLIAREMQTDRYIIIVAAMTRNKWKHEHFIDQFQSVVNCCPFLSSSLIIAVADVSG